MNSLKFNDIKINDEVTFTYNLTQEKMKKFMEITGDINPLHSDLEYAKSKGYPENVVYGMLTSSILSTLAGVYLPGKYSLIHSVEINFIKPVFLSKCPLTIYAKVISTDDRFKQITVKYHIVDIDLQKVCRGTMKIGVTE